MKPTTTGCYIIRQMGSTKTWGWGGGRTDLSTETRAGGMKARSPGGPQFRRDRSALDGAGPLLWLHFSFSWIGSSEVYTHAGRRIGLWSFFLLA